jgi:hypothetical protein
MKIPDVDLKLEHEPKAIGIENDRYHIFDMGKRLGAHGSDCK